MIIVEGADGTGKTTLVQELFEKLKDDFPIAVNGTRGPSEHIVERVHEALAYEVKAGNRPVIYDRLYFSELVYGKILRGEVLFNQAQQKFIMRLLRFLDVPIIIAMPGEDKAFANVTNSDHLGGVLEKFDDIYSHYEGFLDMLTQQDFNVIRYNYEPGISSYMYERLHRYLVERRQREWKPVTTHQHPTESQR